MTEVSSTDQAAAAEGAARSPLPAPPRPPRTVTSDDVGTGLFDGGPSTSAMPPVPDSPEDLMAQGFGSDAFARPVAVPEEQLTGIAMMPPLTVLPGAVAPPPPAPPATGRSYRLPRPGVKVRGP